MVDLQSRLLDLAVAIQQIPAPTFHEAKRAGFVRTRFAEEGLQGVEIDPIGNVYACLSSHHQPPSSKGQALIVSAHLDTVFPPNVDLSVRRERKLLLAPGIGDNSLGVAGLFGLVWALRERGISLPGDLWLVADVCEEGLGNLHGMQAVVDHFETPHAQSGGRSGPLAYIIVEGMALGQIYQRGLGVRRFRLSVQTAGGHSWIDYGQPSAVHELAALSTRITTLELPPQPRTTLNVGIISGGSSVNTIAAEAMLELDLRSESTATLEDLVRQVKQIISSAQKPGVLFELETIGQRPAGELPAEHPLVKLAQDCLREVGIEPRLSIGSTDANLPLSLGLPALTIGLTTGGRAHTVHEFINIAPLEKGVEQLVRLVSRAWD
ncbi:MAG: M20/M25/M40 family metallo-hydrolase [Anaerolineales bacterium]|jgi:acetylornithine deacetylase/succinyl-diaminopimelate desuccinylase-like protein